MEPLLPYVLPLMLVLLSLYIIFLIHKNVYAGNDNMPPGTWGWPRLGESLEFGRLGPHRFVKDRMEKYSQDIFRTSLMGENLAVFCGTKGNKFLFMNENKLLTSWWPKSMKKVLIFPDFVETNLKKVSALKHHFHHEIFMPESLKLYVPLMDALAREHMNSYWTPHSIVKVFPLSKQYTFELACEIFLSVVDSHHIKKLFDPFSDVIHGMSSAPLNFPGTAYSRAIKGGKIVREELVKIINERRKELMENKKTEGRDLLSKMLLLMDENGNFYSEMEICNNIIGLLVASFKSTSSAVAFVLNDLVSLPHIYSRVLEEHMKIAKSKGDDELLTWDDIEKMKYSWNVVRESLRLTPPALGAFRETTTKFTYAGFTIPKGWKTLWTVYSSHMNPEYFHEPHKFDPSRFEGGGPAPYTFVPFGGGPRMCPGKEYARLEVLVFMHNVVTRFELEKAVKDEKIIFRGAPTPVYGLPVRLLPHDMTGKSTSKLQKDIAFCEHSCR